MSRLLLEGEGQGQTDPLPPSTVTGDTDVCRERNYLDEGGRRERLYRTEIK